MSYFYWFQDMGTKSFVVFRSHITHADIEGKSALFADVFAEPTAEIDPSSLSKLARTDKLN